MYGQIFFISLASLLLECALTRIFSITEWYHFAFISISIALFGFGLSGTFLSLFKKRFVHLQDSLNKIAMLFSLSILLGFLIINYIPFDTYRIAWEKEQILYILVYYLLLALPFFFCGLCVGLGLTSQAQKVHYTYFFNLAGSASGIVLTLVFLSLFTLPQVLFLASLLGIIPQIIKTGIFFPWPGRTMKTRIACLIMLGSITYLFFNPLPQFNPRISPYKDLPQLLHHEGAKILSTHYNSSLRLDVLQSKGIKYAPGLSHFYPFPPPDQLGLTTDAGNLSAITCAEQTPLSFLDNLITSLPYHLKEINNMLIIAPGGGLEVLNGIRHGVQSIKVVEKNRLLVNLLSKEYREFSGSIYRHPRVSVHVQHPRLFLKQSAEFFDLISLPLTDSFQAIFAASFSLTEDYLYTLEAFDGYFRHLSSEGILAISRWLQFPPSESLRIWDLVLNGLEGQGIKNPAGHILVLRSWRTSLTLVKKSPFTVREIQEMKNFSRKYGFDLIHYPGIEEKEANIYIKFEDAVYFHAFKGLREKERVPFIYNINYTTDDRPFFFHFFKWENVPYILQNWGKFMLPFGGGGYLVLIVMLFVVVLLSFFLILFPLRFLKKDIRKGRGIFFAYFFSLGIGFLFIEIPLISQSILLFNFPFYAFVIVCGIILFFSGLGSLCTKKIKAETSLFPIFLLGCAAIILAFIIPSYIKVLSGYSLLWRILAMLVALAPLAFLMGTAFPFGLRHLYKFNPDLIPWAWGINGYSSIISAILAIMLSLTFGFRLVIILGGMAYLFAGGLFIFLSREQR